jgi:hypothetical protein
MSTTPKNGNDIMCLEKLTLFQNPKIPHHQNSSKFQKYHTIRTVPKSKNSTQSEHFQNPKIPHHGFWNCPDGVVFLDFGSVLMMGYFWNLVLF